MITDLYR